MIALDKNGIYLLLEEGAVPNTVLTWSMLYTELQR